MSLVNFALVGTELMKDRLEKIESGEIRLGVGNQFDGTALETAIYAVETHEEVVEKAYKDFGHLTGKDFPVMEFAYRLSDLFNDDRSIPRAWID